MGLEQRPAQPPPPPPQEEGRRVVLIARCSSCNWYSSIPSNTLRMAKDADLLNDVAKQHEDRYSHLVKYKVG
jgi:hypothetical protein